MATLSDAHPDVIRHLSEVLAKFSQPNSNSNDIELATKVLSQLSHHEGFVSALFYLICSEPTVQVRQLAAVVLRRKLSKCWKGLAIVAKDSLRQALLERLAKEREAIVSRALMQVIGLISKYEFSTDRSWPQLIAFIGSTARSLDSNISRCGAQLLSIVCETACENLSSHYSAILVLLCEILESCGTNADLAYHSVQAFKALVPFLGTDEIRYVRPLVPKCVDVTKLLLQVDESRAAEILETFESLIETEVGFIAPYVKDLVIFALMIISNSELDDETRIRSLSLLQCVISTKKKAILKHNLIEDILKVIWPIILDSNDEDDDAGFLGDLSDVQTPFASCLQVVDEMALHLPPDKLFAKLLPLIEARAGSADHRHQRGVLLTLACLAEGTSEYIKANHMKAFVSLACKRATENHSQVRNAAMFAIGQFSEFLEPDMNKYAGEVMPILFTALQQTTDTSKSSGITKAYYALENFVENLEGELAPYLDQLMMYLLTTLKSTEDVHVKELVVSAIGATATAAKDKLTPYLEGILSLIRDCLQSIDDESEQGKLNQLHTQALDTLGVLVRTMGKSNIQLSEDSLRLGMALIERDNSDPDLRRAAFGLFASVASIVGEKMEPFLGKIVKSMLVSVESTEGVTAHFTTDNSVGNEQVPDFSFLDDTAEEVDLEKDSDDEDEVGGSMDGFSVENAYMDEKADACECLGDLAKYTNLSFLPLLAGCFDEVFKQTDFPHSDVRKAALATCGQFTVTAHRFSATEIFPNLLSRIYPLMCKVISSDPERVVVMGTIMTAKELIEACGLSAFANREQDLQMLMNSLMKVLTQKSACQDEDENYDEADEDQQAEYDEMLIEYCGEMFPVLATTLGNSFYPYFKHCLPIFTSKLKGSSTTAERSFGAGTVAETVDKLGGSCAAELLPQLLPKFITLSRDNDAEVRNNSIYGLGVMMQHSGAAGGQHYPTVLACLSQALGKESSRRVTDNILGAVCRMIVANCPLVPVKQVIPVLLEHLPIGEDHDEDATVYGCLANLLRNPDIVADIALSRNIVSALTQACHNEQVQKDVRTNIDIALRGMISGKAQHQPAAPESATNA